MIKMIAFDFDGTIGDTMEMCVDIFKQTLAACTGHPVSYEEIARTFGLNEQGMLQRLAGGKWEQAYTDLLIRYRQNLPRCSSPFPGIPELLEELKNRHIQTALITGKGKETCGITLEQYHMTHAFCAIETGRNDRADKDTAMERLMTAYNLPCGDFIYVGDTPSDAEAAHRAGVTCLSAAYGSTADIAGLEKANPGNVFKTVQALRNAIMNLHVSGIPQEKSSVHQGQPAFRQI